MKLILSRYTALIVYTALLSCGYAGAQTLDSSPQTPAILPRGTPLEIKLAKHLPTKAGEPLDGTLVYPVYVDDKLVLPSGTVVNGTVVALSRDGARRRDARLNADFTPYSDPTVTFTQIVLANGAVLPIKTDTVQNGSQIIHLAAQEKSQKSMLARQRSAVVNRMGETKRAFTAPGLGDRIKQTLYRLLPYHPQRIEDGTAWTVELASDVPAAFAAPAVPSEHPVASVLAPTDGAAQSLALHAYLGRELSSGTDKAGDRFEAIVAEPVRDDMGHIVVPQGSILWGTVTRSQPARSRARSGVLRFDFRDLKLPNGEQQEVTGSLIGADANAKDSLQMDSEGGVTPKPQPGKVIVPVALSLLAARSLSDAPDAAATSSNGLGLVGTIVGVASNSSVAAGIGFYGAGITVYRRLIRHGKEITFAKDTRIDVEFTRQAGERLAQK